MPPTERREEECKSSKYSLLPIEGFLALCELVMNLSSYQIELEGKIKFRYACELDLDLFFKFIKKSDLICELKISFDLLYYSVYLPGIL